MPILQSNVSFKDPNYLKNKAAKRKQLIRHVAKHINDNQGQYSAVERAEITSAPHMSARPDDHLDVDLHYSDGRVINTHFPVDKSLARKEAKNQRRKTGKKKENTDKDDQGGGSSNVATPSKGSKEDKTATSGAGQSEDTGGPSAQAQGSKKPEEAAKRKAKKTNKENDESPLGVKDAEEAVEKLTITDKGKEAERAENVEKKPSKKPKAGKKDVVEASRDGDASSSKKPKTKNKKKK